MINADPQRDMVLVSLVNETERASGGIEVVRSSVPTSCYADVHAVGPDVRDVRPGSRYIVSRLQGIALADGTGRVLLPESAVMALMEEDEPDLSLPGREDYDRD